MKFIERDTQITGGGRGIIFIDGKYYMLSDSPAKVCVSEDLENWTEYQLNSSYLKPQNIAFGNGVFVICGLESTSDNTYIYYSKDGITWSAVELPTTVDFSIDCYSVKFINNKFVIASAGWRTTWSTAGVITKIEENVVFFESLNGINWTLRLLTIDRGTDTNYKNAKARDIEYHNGLYVYVGNNGNIYTSTDLTNWDKRSSGVDAMLVSISYGKSQFVACGDYGTILTSPDGFTWTKRDSTIETYIKQMKYANGTYLGLGNNGELLESYDGIMWQNVSEETSGTRFGMAYNNEADLLIVTAWKYSSSGTIPIYIAKLSRNLSTDTEEDSSLFFFDKELNMLGIVDYFISLRWRRKYFEAGEFEIVLPVNDYMMSLISYDVLVMRNNYTEAGIIESIEFSDDGTNEEVTISGRFLSALLERRIVKSKINFSGNTVEGMNTIVNAMTPLTSQWETETVTISSPSVDFQVTYKNVYDYLKKLSEYSNIGFRVVPNVESKVYMFEVWKGIDRTSAQNENEEYSFSDDNYNIEQGKIIMSEKTKATYVLVGGQGEDSSRVLVSVDDGSIGFDRYEIFSDQKNLRKEELSDSAYQNKLKQVGDGLLKNGTFRLEVTALIQQDYKKKWNLGDIVNIKKEKWGVYTTYRIIEVEETIEDGKKTIYPTFGSPLSSAWENEK
jgi:hypothetical protein